MEQYLIWKVLEIEETKDENIIRQAYRRKLSDVNPEEDQAGFMRLREAYEQALAFAAQDEVKSDDMEALKNGSEVDQWIYRINRIYEDVDKRRDPAKWQEAFEADICNELDLDSEISERLLVYIMSHHYMPMEVWQTIDAKFHYVDDVELLKEKFPEDFLNYVQYKVSHEEFIDFTIFGGDTTEHVDDYLYKYFDLKNLCDRTDGTNPEEISAAVKALDDYDVYYPYADVEKVRYYILTKTDENLQKAVELADSLYSEYPDNPYIAYYCGEAMEKSGHIREAEEIWQKLLDEDQDHYMAKYGIAKIMADRGELAEAKEYCLDLLDIDDRSQDLREFLDRLNEKLIVIYKEKLAENADDFETTNKLAWCYFQMQDFKAVENLLNGLDEKYHEEYDYINLIGRNYLAMDEYDKAMQYLPKWRDMIEATVDDGSKEAKKRLNRRGFSYFAIGYCQWNQNLIAEATENLYKSFELEDKLLTKLSYMDQMALFYLDAGSYDQAIEMCNQVIAQDRNYFPAYVKRQQAYYEQKNGQGIIDDFYECIRIYPGYVKPYVLAYKTFYFYRQYEDAEGIWKRAEEAGLKSDEMQLYRFKIRRMTRTGKENWQKTLGEMIKFRDQYFARLNEKREENQEEESDLEEPAELYLEIGLLYWNLDDINAAMRTVEEGLHKYGDHINLLWLKGDLLMDTKDENGALHCYRKIAETEPDNANIHINIGKCLDKLGLQKMNDRAEKAILEYQKAYELNPNHSEVNFLLMRMYKRKFLHCRSDKESYKKALFHANAQLELTEDAYYYIERGLLYEEAHELEQALADFLKAAKMEPDNIYAHNNAANVYCNMKKYEEALRELRIALSLPNEGQSVWVFSGMADAYEGMENYQKAIEYTQKQLEFVPRSSFLLNNLARRYCKQKQYQKAREVYANMFQNNLMEGWRVQCEKAECYSMEGRESEAEKCYQNAIRQEQGNQKVLLECYRRMGDFYHHTDAFKKAIDAYLKCIELVNNLDERIVANRYFDIAESYHDMGDRYQAAVYAHKYLDLIIKLDGSPENRIWDDKKYSMVRAYYIAYAFVMTGDLEQAEKYQNIVWNCYPCDECYMKECSEAYYGWGLIREAQGRLAEAVEYMEKAAVISDGYVCGCDSRRALKRIRKKMAAMSGNTPDAAAENAAVAQNAEMLQNSADSGKKGILNFFRKKK
ncbi:MAG: tetratricopeptide repeat protein [Lachnospiraceae bacterium]